MSSSLRAKGLRTTLSLTLKPMLSLFPINDKSFFYTRLLIDGLSKIVPNSLLASIRPFYISDVPVEWVQTKDYNNCSNSKTRVVLYLHGGAYIVGSPKTHRHITTRMALLSGCRVLAVNYRKGPDHMFPAAHDDALKAYRWLLSEGYSPKNIAFAGDSAGGNLCIALTKILKEKSLPIPACLGLMSPWTNMASDFKSSKTNRFKDPYLPADRMIEAARLYAGNRDLRCPELSPVFGDLSNMPPTIIHCSSIEVVRDDSIIYTKNAKAAGSQVDLEIYDGLPHVWQFFNWYLPEGRDSLLKISKYFIKHWRN